MAIGLSAAHRAYIGRQRGINDDSSPETEGVNYPTFNGSKDRKPKRGLFATADKVSE